MFLARLRCFYILEPPDPRRENLSEISSVFSFFADRCHKEAKPTALFVYMMFDYEQ